MWVLTNFFEVILKTVVIRNGHPVAKNGNLNVSKQLKKCFQAVIGRNYNTGFDKQPEFDDENPDQHNRKSVWQLSAGDLAPSSTPLPCTHPSATKTGKGLVCREKNKNKIKFRASKQDQQPGRRFHFSATSQSLIFRPSPLPLCSTRGIVVSVNMWASLCVCVLEGHCVLIWWNGWSYEKMYSLVYWSVKDARMLSFTSLMMCGSSQMKQESSPPPRTHTHTHTVTLALLQLQTLWLSYKYTPLGHYCWKKGAITLRLQLRQFYSRHSVAWMQMRARICTHSAKNTREKLTTWRLKKK